jgi:hypothetical protein
MKEKKESRVDNGVACIDCEVMQDTIKDIERQTRIQVLYEVFLLLREKLKEAKK